MDVIDRRMIMGRVLASMAGGNYRIIEETIEIGPNTISLARDAEQYLVNALSARPLAIFSINLVEAYTVENQFISYEYGKNVDYGLIVYRFKNNNTLGFEWADNSYALKIIEGTHYTVSYIA